MFHIEIQLCLGAIVDRDLGFPQVGDTIKLKFKDQFGNDVLQKINYSWNNCNCRFSRS